MKLWTKETDKDYDEWQKESSRKQAKEVIPRDRASKKARTPVRKHEAERDGDGPVEPPVISAFVENAQSESEPADRAAYVPRVRESETLNDRLAMEEAHASVVNTVPAFPAHEFGTWVEFQKVYMQYQKDNNLHFRVRSSVFSKLHNELHANSDDQIPEHDFLRRERVCRCTHGLFQKSRSKGIRHRNVRYTGCKARFTPKVAHMEDGTIKIILTNETRNLIRSILGKDSAEERLKNLLHGLVQQEGSDVLLIQDQMGVTCGIVMQTKVPKMFFERWGQTLAMDFTHGTNNLGFHLGATTEAGYERSYNDLKAYCSQHKRSAIQSYFYKNWHSCRDMWANYARGTYFTAGNTTTSRIESNWNQLKMLLDHKTRIDKTIAGLLKHQVTITQQIVSSLRQHATTSRVPWTVPAFLRRVAGHLSNHTFEKVKKEWERYVILMGDATCEQAGVVSQWKVCCSVGTYECNDLQWTCSCLFNRNNQLPCRHLMHLARKGHGFEALPASSISERWCMHTAVRAAEELATAAASLVSITQMSKLRSPDLRLPEDTHGGATHIAGPARTREKQVVYVRLRRNERANLIVLTSAEKYSYAKTMLEPLLDHLSALSSANFYRELRAWKETIECGLRKGKYSGSGESAAADTTAESVGTDEYDSDATTSMDPADAIETMVMMNVMEDEEHSATIDSWSDDLSALSPAFDLATLSHMSLPEFAISDTTIDMENNTTMAPSPLQEEDPLRDAGVSEAETEILDCPGSDEAAEDPPKNVPTIEERQVDVMKMPKPPRRTNTITTLTQKRIPSCVRYATVQYPSDLTVDLEQLVRWARATPNLKTVIDMLEMYPVILDEPFLRGRPLSCDWKTIRPTDYSYNFVIPSDLVSSMQAVVNTTRDEEEADSINVEQKEQGFTRDLIVELEPQLKTFSSKFVNTMTNFYDTKARCKAWQEDMK
ncbi:hypothetical protein BBJ28_00014860 [Nothophytophthora sp. Chile5]|nr:hypothetical protein BBJ28_00014860 [Nothophytophthora sp. Chile5]